MSMQFPSRAVMETLRAIRDGLEMSPTSDNRLFIVLPPLKLCEPFRVFEVNLEHVDILESRGWIDLSQGEDEIHVTEAGKHWCRRYWERKGAVA